MIDGPHENGDGAAPAPPEPKAVQLLLVTPTQRVEAGVDWAFAAVPGQAGNLRTFFFFRTLDDMAATLAAIWLTINARPKPEAEYMRAKAKELFAENTVGLKPPPERPRIIRPGDL